MAEAPPHAPPRACRGGRGGSRAHVHNFALPALSSLSLSLGLHPHPGEPTFPLLYPVAPPPPCRDLGTEFLTCDCRLRWLLSWARNRSVQLSERTLCAYPSTLHAQTLGGLQEAQLRCGEQTRTLRLPPEGPLLAQGSLCTGLGLQGVLSLRSHWGLVLHLLL